MQIRKMDNKLHIEGYVNISDKKSRVLHENGIKFIEEVEPRCFQRALGRADNIELLLNHDPNKKLGSLREGNITLKEDNIGLYIRADIENEDAIKAYDEGGFSGFSYGFTTINDKYRDWDSGLKLRTLKDINLIEVSLLDSKTTPAYYGTMVDAETRELNTKEVRNFVADELEEIDNSRELKELREYAEIIEEVLELI